MNAMTAPEGFAPVQSAAPSDIPAGFEPVNKPPAGPEGFEPVPASELRPITPEPPGFLNRMQQGARVMERLQSVWKATKEGFGDAPLSPDTGMPNGLGNLIKRPVEAFDLLSRTINAGIHGVADVAAQGVQAGGASQGMSERAREDVQNFGTWLLTEGGMRATMGDAVKHAPLVDAGNGDLARIVPGPDGRATAQVVGKYPPTHEDFANAAETITAKKPIEQDQLTNLEGHIANRQLNEAIPTEQSRQTVAAQEGSGTTFPPANDTNARVQAKLHQMWEEQGIHPVEAAEDAKNDAFVAHDLSSAAAHPTDIPPLAPNQPLSIPGKIVSDLRSLRDRAFDVSGWIQNALAPISTASDPAIRYTTEYLSNTRRIQWEWMNTDKRIVDNFTKEQREAVWRALDEESVMAQSGERSEHMGIATLSPEENALAKELTEHAIATRLQMKDRGMVEDEGLPFYAGRTFRGIQRGEQVSLGPDVHVREATGSMKHRQYLTAEESEAAAKAKFGPQVELVRDIRTLPMILARQQRAIAAHDFIDGVKKFGQDIGDPQILEGAIPAGEESKWFTIPDSDLFKWQMLPKAEEGAGFDKMVKAPIHIKMDWKGAIQAVADTKFNAWDKVIVETKNRPMTLIMNSPFLHDSVVYSKALPSNPGNMLTFRFMRQGPQLLQDQKFMTDMLDAGLVPWGKRAGFKQEITGMMENVPIEPGRGLTQQIVGYVPDLYSKDLGDKVKSTMDRAAEFWHDKLLGQQVQKLQASLAYDFRETLRKKFPQVPEDVLNVLAAHEGNRFGGSLPPEAMSAFSRGVTNALFFSRQFTFGNLGILKDAAKGPPEYVMARVRDMLGTEGATEAEALRVEMRRHAFAVVALDIAMYYGANALLQSGVNVASGTPMSDEVAGYWWRLKQATNRVVDHPAYPSSYLSFLPSLSPTFYHEPGKEGKILLGYRADGTAIYGRSVIGRMGEDYTGLVINPALWALTKAAPLPRAMYEILGNKDGFDRPIYDPNALRHGDLTQAWNIAKHFIDAELPMQQVQGAANLVTGKGDYKDAINTFGPYAPPPFTVTGSQGYPGGPEAGVVAAHQRNQRTAQDLQMSDVKSMVVDKNDIPGAQQKMTELGVNPRLQRALIRGWQHPGMSKTSPRAMAEFYQNASPFEREILDAMRTR